MRSVAPGGVVSPAGALEYHNSRDSGRVVAHFDDLEPGRDLRQREHAVALAETEFGDQVGAVAERARERHQAGDDGEPAVGGEEREVRLVGAHVGRHELGLGGIDIGRIAHHQIEGARIDRFGEIGVDESDAVVEVEARAIVARAGEGGERKVGGDEAPARPLGGEGERDRAGSGADVERPRLGGQREGERDLDDRLGLGARDEDAIVDLELAAEELLPAEVVSGRLAALAARDELAEAALLGLRQRGIVMGEKGDLIAAEDVGEEEARFAARRLGHGSAQAAAPLLDQLADRRHDPILCGINGLRRIDGAGLGFRTNPSNVREMIDESSLIPLRSRTMDEKDLQILSILQQDGRTSNAEIARRMGMAPSAVLERIRKLEQRGAILGYHARLDAEQLGSGLLAFVFVQVDDRQEEETTGKRLSRMPQVQEVHHIAGEDCYLVKLRCASTQELGRILQQDLGDFGSIRRTRTTIVLGTIKEELDVEVPTADRAGREKGNVA